MKLLFDANLSPRLVSLTRKDFPGASHVFDCGGLEGDDRSIWDYARRNGSAIVSKDSDFHHMSLVLGAPPKVVWLRVGNLGTHAIARILRHRRDWIAQFHEDHEATFLVLGP